MESSSVPAGAIYDAKDMIEDPHFNERKMFEQVQVQDHTLTVFFYFLISCKNLYSIISNNK